MFLTLISSLMSPLFNIHCDKSTRTSVLPGIFAAVTEKTIPFVFVCFNPVHLFLRVCDKIPDGQWGLCVVLFRFI